MQDTDTPTRTSRLDDAVTVLRVLVKAPVREAVREAIASERRRARAGEGSALVATGDGSDASDGGSQGTDEPTDDAADASDDRTANETAGGSAEGDDADSDASDDAGDGSGRSRGLVTKMLVLGLGLGALAYLARNRDRAVEGVPSSVDWRPTDDGTGDADSGTADARSGSGPGAAAERDDETDASLGDATADAPADDD